MSTGCLLLAVLKFWPWRQVGRKSELKDSFSRSSRPLEIRAVSQGLSLWNLLFGTSAFWYERQRFRIFVSHMHDFLVWSGHYKILGLQKLQNCFLIWKALGSIWAHNPRAVHKAIYRSTDSDFHRPALFSGGVTSVIHCISWIRMYRVEFLQTHISWNTAAQISLPWTI